MKKLILLIATLSACLCASAATYTNIEVTESVRKSLDYSSIITYLPATTNYVTPALSTGTMTKMLVSTEVIRVVDFSVVDVDPTEGIDYRYQYQGAEARAFRIHVSTEVSASQANIVFRLGVYQNDAGFIKGVVGQEWRGVGADTGRFAISGYVVLQPLDTLSFWATLTSGSNCTLTFNDMSILVIELN